MNGGFVMYERISNDQFLEIMERLQGKPVWLKVVCDTLSVDLFYEDFEFLSFTNGKDQFGHADYNEENNYQNLMIDIDTIAEIHRNKYSMFFGEEIILTMIDGIQLIIEFGC